jgi:hypothetical protein
MTHPDLVALARELGRLAISIRREVDDLSYAAVGVRGFMRGVATSLNDIRDVLMKEPAAKAPSARVERLAREFVEWAESRPGAYERGEFPAYQALRDAVLSEPAAEADGPIMRGIISMGRIATLERELLEERAEHRRQVDEWASRCEALERELAEEREQRDANDRACQAAIAGNTLATQRAHAAEAKLAAVARILHPAVARAPRRSLELFTEIFEESRADLIREIEAAIAAPKEEP